MVAILKTESQILFATQPDENAKNLVAENSNMLLQSKMKTPKAVISHENVVVKDG